jgi:plastocyanin
MQKRVRVALVLTSLIAVAFATMRAIALPPTPDPAFLKQAQLKQLPSPCEATNPYEAALWQSYGKDCRRLHFAFGPIIARPGQNDALIEPVTIEKPAYPGYIVRFKPDLVDQTGKAPDISQVHLHHATWLNGYPQYGSGPFFAAGEEKTIATFPPGYGMHVGAADVWLLLYMVHNATATPHVVWITYDIDFIPEKAAAKHHIVPVKPVWLDVQRSRIADGAPSTSSNPVFNVQQHYGHPDVSSFARLNTGFNDGERTSGGAVKQVCSWPLENCARHDVYGGVTPQQGVPISIPGADWTVPADFEGTLIGIGGHLHPGGIRDEVSLVRGGVEKPVFISDAVAWQRKPASTAVAGGPKTSWDFSMGVTGSTIGWKLKIKTGDKIRLNAVYDSNDASWYENMGIVVALLAPKNAEKEDALHGGPGVDVFDQAVTLNPGLPDSAIPTPGWLPATCHPNTNPANGALTLCLRGQITHGHMKEASTFGGCPAGGCQSLPTKGSARVVDKIVSLGFTFGNADLGLIGQTGIPRVKLGKPLTFYNFDTVADVWHTFTGCKYPCTGAYGLDYPLANGAASAGDVRDFDSTEIGYGLFFSPASGQFGGDKPFQQALQDGFYATFTPTQTGIYSLYCRIHPAMRGAFKVVN